MRATLQQQLGARTRADPDVPVTACRPFDVIKTRTMTAPAGSAAGFLAIAGALLEKEGLRGLWRGALWRAAYIAPVGFMNFTLYEIGKDKLGIANAGNEAAQKLKQQQQQQRAQQDDAGAGGDGDGQRGGSSEPPPAGGAQPPAPTADAGADAPAAGADRDDAGEAPCCAEPGPASAEGGGDRQAGIQSHPISNSFRHKLGLNKPGHEANVPGNAAHSAPGPAGHLASSRNLWSNLQQQGHAKAQAAGRACSWQRCQ